MKNDVRIDLEAIHPNLKFKVNKLLKVCEEKGIGIIITEGYRSVYRQDELYAQGRTRPGKIVTKSRGESYSSQHQWGVAFDIAINEKNDEYNTAKIKKVADMAKELGLAWGGDWKTFQDTPHFYLPKWGSTTRTLKNKYGTFANFKKTWSATVNYSGLRLYKNTSKKEILKRLPKGTRVKVLYKKLWYAKIEHEGTVGFVRKKHLK